MSRTYGETQNCAGCRFWSEMLAQSNGGPVEAMCLAEGGPFSGKYVTAGQRCDKWKSGHFGAVDDPPNYGEETRALYGNRGGGILRGRGGNGEDQECFGAVPLADISNLLADEPRLAGERNMKISDAIRDLNDFLDTYGDIDVLCIKKTYDASGDCTMVSYDTPNIEVGNHPGKPSTGRIPLSTQYVRVVKVSA